MSAPKTRNPKVGAKRKAVPKSRWGKDVRADGNLFYLEACLKFMVNLCTRFKGTLEDRDAFLPVARIMTREKLLAIFTACTTERVRQDMKGRDYGRINDPGDEDSTNLLKALWRHPQSNQKFRTKLLAWLDHVLVALAAWQIAQLEPVRSRFEDLRRLFRLSDIEFDTLVAAAAVGNNSVWPCEDLRGVLSCEKILKVAAMLGVAESEYLATVKAKSKLRRYGCLDSNGDITPEIQPFITGVDDTPLVSRYFKKSEAEALPWEFFGELAAQHGTFLKRLIAVRTSERGVNILLYGEPGTGKTSFALALATELGRTPYLIPHADDEHKSKGKAFRFSALQICDAQVDADKSIIVIDESDEMLGGGAGSLLRMLLGDSSSAEGKGLLNDVLDNVKSPCIWITNSSAGTLDGSHRRRFDYSIKFDKLTCVQRERIWKNAIAQHAIDGTLPEPALSRLAARYEVSAGGISLAAHNLSAMLKGGTAAPEDAEAVVETILRPHCKLLEIGDDNDKLLVAADYSLEGLNIKGSITPDKVTGAIRRYQEEQRADTRGRGTDRPRMNLLLSGPSGTGKTEFVKHLGAELNMRVVMRMGSDLLDRYVGGTEQNIRQAFEQAAADKAILLLDEVDGMMHSRERATNSWQVTQVNEFLHQMENFESVLVCATNFMGSLDTATVRRFTFKLEFDYLTAEGKAAFFKRMFAGFGAARLTQEDETRLKRIPGLAPGDFRTVRQSLFYMGGEVTASILLEGLERESAAKRMGATARPIGFR